MLRPNITPVAPASMYEATLRNTAASLSCFTPPEKSTITRPAERTTRRRRSGAPSFSERYGSGQRSLSSSGSCSFTRSAPISSATRAA